jgi:NAD(P)H-hydrate repair Nnr-like enzyme with NAD(P)H-hydrate dehydratase domain
MPGYHRAEVSAELTVTASAGGREPPRAQEEAARRAASRTGLAHEGGPGSTMVAGGRDEVLAAAVEAVAAALDAGARCVQVKFEASGDAPRFQRG